MEFSREEIIDKYSSQSTKKTWIERGEFLFYCVNYYFFSKDPATYYCHYRKEKLPFTSQGYNLNRKEVCIFGKRHPNRLIT
jgi:hypothetical protein